MKKAKDIAMLLQGCQDPQMVAEASRDFFLSAYSRVCERSAYIFGEGIEPEKGTQLVPLKDVIGQDFFVELKHLKETIDSVTADSVDDTTVDAEIWLTDAFDNNKRYLTSHQSVAHQMGAQADSNYILYAGFQALLDQHVKKSTSFFESIMLYAQGKSQTVSNALVKVHQYVNTGESDLASANQALLNFGGVDTYIENPTVGVTYDTDIGEYTGVHPVSGIMAGIFYDVTNVLGKVDSLFLYQYEIAFRMYASIGKGIFKVGVKLVSWIGNWLKKNFIDPVDYKMLNDDKTINTFAIPGKMRIPCQAGTWTIGDGIMENSWYRYIGLDMINNALKGDPTEYWFNFFGNMYRITPAPGFQPKPENSKSGSTNDIIVERWMKPLNYEAVLAVLTENSFFTVNGLRYTMAMLQRSDCSLPSDAGELEVFKGCVLSHAIEAALSKLIHDIYDGMYTNVQPTGSSWYKEEALDGDVTILNQAGYKQFSDFLTAIRDAAYYIKNDFDSDTARIPFANGNYKLSAIKSRYLDNGRVTNLSLLRITTTMCTAPYSTWVNDDTFRYVYDCTVGSMTINGLPAQGAYKNSMGREVPYAFAPILMWAGDRQVSIATPDLRTVTIGYHHGSSSSRSNVTIKTDQENVDKATSAALNTVITAAAVAVTVYVGVKAVKFLKQVPKWQASRDTLRFNYGEAIAKGNTELADSLWKQQKLLSLRMTSANIVKGALLGGPQAAASIVGSVASSKQTPEAQTVVDLKSVTNGQEGIHDAITDQSQKLDESQSDQTKAILAGMAVQSAADIAETIIILRKIKAELANESRGPSNTNGNW